MAHVPTRSLSLMPRPRSHPRSLLSLLLLLLVVALLLPSADAQWKRLWQYAPPSAHAATPSEQRQPLKRAAHSLVAFQDSLYVFGGIGDSAAGDDHEYDDTWRFDLANDKWVEIVADGAGAPNASTSTGIVSPPRRFHHATVLHTNATVAEMIVFGGLSIGQQPSGAGAATSVDTVVTQFNDVWRLSLSPDGEETWRLDPTTTTTTAAARSSSTNATNTTAGSAGPAPRSEAGAVAHDGQLYVFGGIAYDEVIDTAPRNFGDLWQYDLAACAWTQLVPRDGVAPPARFSHSLTAFTTAQNETFLLVFSGRRLELPSWSLLGDTWVFSLQTRTWRQLQTTLPLQRAYTSVVATSGVTPKFWFFGGYFRPKQGSSGYVYDDVVAGYVLPSLEAEATTATTSTTDMAPARVQFYHAVLGLEDAVPPLRYNHRAVLWRDTMIVHGGSYQTQRGDLWQFNLTEAVLTQDAAAALPVNMETLVYVLGGFVFSIVVVLVVLIVRWRRIDRRNMELARMRGVSASRGLPRERLDQMEIVKYKKPPTPPSSPLLAALPAAPHEAGDGSDPNDHNNEDICPICLIEFEEDEDVRNLPCKHLFHVPCIDEWLGRNTTCPMCKNNLDLEAGTVVEIVSSPASPTSANARSSTTAGSSPSAMAPPRSTSVAAEAQPRGGSIVTPVLTGPS